jgi:hypothetical protein
MSGCRSSIVVLISIEIVKLKNIYKGIQKRNHSTEETRGKKKNEKFKEIRMKGENEIYRWLKVNHLLKSHVPLRYRRALVRYLIKEHANQSF